MVVDTAMQIERQDQLIAAPNERARERQGHANGHKPKMAITRVRNIIFDVPQVREGGSYPQSLEKGLRSEPALKLTLSEICAQGVSMRKVVATTEKLYGTEISSAQVIRATAELDEQFVTWCKRPPSLPSTGALSALPTASSAQTERFVAVYDWLCCFQAGILPMPRQSGGDGD